MNRFKWPKRLAAGALLALILSLSLAVPVAAVPVVPLLFTGDVTIDGADAPIGTTISAEIESAEVNSTSTTMAGRYAISIDYDSGYIGKTVVLKVNGTVGGEGTYVDPMETPVVTVNLAVTGVTTYTLTMAVSGNGTTDPSAGDHDYTAGTVVDITATADAGWGFDSWTGDVASPNSATTTVTIDSDKTVTANFGVTTTTTPPTTTTTTPPTTTTTTPPTTTTTTTPTVTTTTPPTTTVTVTPTTTVTVTPTTTVTVTPTTTVTVTETETLPPETITTTPPPVTTTETLPPTTATETETVVSEETITETAPLQTITTTPPPVTITETEPGKPQTNWLLAGGLIAAVVVVGLGVFFWMRRRAT